MSAPVCNVSPKIPPPLGQVPALPAIPTATNPQTTMAAVNAIRQWLIQFLGPEGNTTTTNGVISGDFIENPKARITTTTRIYDPNDPTKETYVDVAQIVGLQFINSRTGQTINWAQTPK